MKRPILSTENHLRTVKGWVWQQCLQSTVVLLQVSFLFTSFYFGHEIEIGKTRNLFISTERIRSSPPGPPGIPNAVCRRANWRSAGLRNTNISAGARSLRFPSTDERIKFYMTSWYAPPSCNKGFSTAYEWGMGRGNVTFFQIAGITQNNLMNRVSTSLTVSTMPACDAIFVLDDLQVTKCSNYVLNKTHPKSNMYPTKLKKTYCPELLTDLVPIWKRKAPLLIQVGDSQETARNARRLRDGSTFVSFPHFAKTRYAWDNQSVWDDCSYFKTSCLSRPVSDGRLQRIIWKLNKRRHFPSKLTMVFKEDVAWREKVDGAIFRGSDTGGDRLRARISKMAANDGCMLVPRCRLCLLHENSTLIDARLVPRFLDQSFKHELKRLYTAESPKSAMLRYKVVIILEGNDVATGLKWAMLSNSVVMMPKPSISSWFMEELLQPYIHYVPVKSDFSDAEAQVKWVLDHQRQSRQIAQRATLWVKDLLFHEKAEEDEATIQEEIVNRYSALFQQPQLII